MVFGFLDLGAGPQKSISYLKGRLE